MNTKSILFSFLAIAICATAYITSNRDKDVIADYSTRDSQQATSSLEGLEFVNQALRSNIETGKIEPNDRLEMMKAVEKHANLNKNNKNAAGFTWTELGPDNFGGRTRAILVYDAANIYAGSVSGGLWKSENGGNNWSKVSSFPYQIIGSIAKTGNGDIYVGTGSKFEGASANGSSGFIGNGLYRSTDMGASWTAVEGTIPSQISTTLDWRFVNALEGDPANEDRVWFAADAGVGYYDSGDNALEIMIDDAGQDIVISPDGNDILVSVSSGKIRLSDDGGQTFSNQYGSGGDLPSSGKNRARVAMGHDGFLTHMYVAYSKTSGAFGGLWETTNFGDSWSEVWSDDIPFLNCTGNQGYYDLALAVDPLDANKVFVGGLTIWKGGSNTNEEQISTYFQFEGPFQLHVHPDIHEIVFGDDGFMYIGCDGGIFGSVNNGQAFFPLNKGYNVMTFYNMAQTSTLNGVAGGAQDNGTMFIPGDGSLPTMQEGINVFGGDGFGVEFSLVTDGDVIGFATSQNGSLGRSNVTLNTSGSMFYNDNLIDAVGEPGEIGPFYTDIALFEDTEDEDSQQFIELINPHQYDFYDLNTDDDVPASLVIYSKNKNIPFYHIIEDTLHYWPELVRDAIITQEPLTVDPNYYWLDVQDLDEIVEICVNDTLETFIDTIVGSIDPILYCDTNFIYDTIGGIIIDTFFVDCVTIGFDTTWVENITFNIEDVCYNEYHYAADVQTDVREHRLIQDTYTSQFAIGFSGNEGIWMTRGALNYTDPVVWMRIKDSAPSNGTKDLTFSHDGDRLYYAEWFGNSVEVISNLDQVYNGLSNPDSTHLGGDIDLLEYSTIQTNAGGQVTGISCDPNNPNHMVISVGKYGIVGNGKIQETWNALDASPDWENVWFENNTEPLSRMPCYDVLIDGSDESGQTLIAGTEFGIYTTDDGGTTWTQENDPADASQSTGIDATPVFELRQQVVEYKRWWHPENTYSVYAATHGRGMFRADNHLETGVDELPSSSSEFNGSLNVYPNPANTTTTLDFNLNSHQDVTIKIYSIQGELIKTISKDDLSRGNNSLRIDVTDMTQGNYIIHLEAGSSSQVGKFVIIK